MCFTAAEGMPNDPIYPALQESKAGVILDSIFSKSSNEQPIT